MKLALLDGGGEGGRRVQQCDVLSKKVGTGNGGIPLQAARTLRAHGTAWACQQATVQKVRLNADSVAWSVKCRGYGNMPPMKCLRKAMKRKLDGGTYRCSSWGRR